MQSDIIKKHLAVRGYTVADTDFQTACCMMRNFMSSVRVCIIVDNTGTNSINPMELKTEAEKLEKKFSMDEETNAVFILNIIITDKDVDTGGLSDSGLKFWLYDEREQRLFIYENQPNDFENLHSVIDNNTAATDFVQAAGGMPFTEGIVDSGHSELNAPDQEAPQYFTPNRDAQNEFFAPPEDYNQTSYSITLDNDRLDAFKRLPFATIILIVVNVIVFMITESTGSSEDAEHMIKMGADYYKLVFFENEYYRLFTCIFLHFGFRHLFNNMLSLGVLGINLERRISAWKFLIIYFICGIVSSMGSAFYNYSGNHNSVSAGASGAIYGMFGVFIVFSLVDKDKNLTRIVFMTALLILSSFEGNTDFAAHITGLIAGVIVTYIFCRKEMAEIRRGLYYRY